MTSLPSSLATHTVRLSTRLTPSLRQHLLTLCHKGSNGGGHRLRQSDRRLARRAVQQLARQLASAQIPTAELHGDLGRVAVSGTLRSSHPARARPMVATDIAARANARGPWPGYQGASAE
jgi:hypothetical protein